MERRAEGIGLNGSELRCSPSIVVFDTREVGFLTEPVTPVVSHLYEEERRVLPLRLLIQRLPGVHTDSVRALPLDSYPESTYIHVHKAAWQLAIPHLGFGSNQESP